MSQILFIGTIPALPMASCTTAPSIAAMHGAARSSMPPARSRDSISGSPPSRLAKNRDGQPSRRLARDRLRRLDQADRQRVAVRRVDAELELELGGRSRRRTENGARNGGRCPPEQTSLGQFR
ncbi:hypothetical protein [Bradyrhizobium sp. NP1]|uniref:hypothetical protein n=1 Tax=Bradyrhizobium sp. NP1 TaxID=3049772 RepID=UPI0025A60425|nr:hypothetical protein [Bradyrhizobium sp. NP1]WJR81478.1 hypothetical protein QOU61_17550 [Bradyrhizobium sp. NP1]